ncbi:MAG: hypothetical protein J3K34DRAFT_398510 [Monoraphidium minutum]|nr:MAG: hypothetical protein J3K34DRAFT_398510 [Monoraphidium minutum]
MCARGEGGQGPAGGASAAAPLGGRQRLLPAPAVLVRGGGAAWGHWTRAASPRQWWCLVWRAGGWRHAQPTEPRLEGAVPQGGGQLDRLGSWNSEPSHAAGGQSAPLQQLKFRASARVRCRQVERVNVCLGVRCARANGRGVLRGVACKVEAILARRCAGDLTLRHRQRPSLPACTRWLRTGQTQQAGARGRCMRGRTGARGGGQRAITGGGRAPGDSLLLTRAHTSLSGACGWLDRSL